MPDSVITDIAALQRMSVDQLRDRWRELYGEDSRSRNKPFLYRRLAWRVQELRYAGLSDRAKARLAELAPDSFVRARPPNVVGDVAAPALAPKPVRDMRLPVVGSVITKRYKGRELRVVVREGGFEFEGAVFASLSALARKITGSIHINGKLFFGVVTRKR